MEVGSVGPPALWRVATTVDGGAMPDVLEAFDDVADSVSLIEVEDPATAEALAWRLELTFRARPDLAMLRRLVGRLLGTAAAARLELAPVPAVDWVLAGNLQIEPIAVGRFFVHGAKDAHKVPDGARGILLEAGLAFGSGDHATTRACLAALDRLARGRRLARVLDLGCGSGILGIAAALCCGARVVAADIDAVAVRVAAQNARQNEVAGLVRTVVADGYRHPLIRRTAPFDLVLANILAGPLMAFAPALARHLAPGGIAVLSGLLDRQAAAVVAAHRLHGLRLVGRTEEGPWVALILRRPSGRGRGGRRPARRRSGQYCALSGGSL